MFMSYDISKSQRGPEKCRGLNENKYIIVYGGGFHAEIYNRVIKRYFGIKSMVSGRVDGSPCIIFDEPFDFFEGV